MLEWVCENERDTPHLAVPKNRRVKLSDEFLAKYAGTYEFAAETPPKNPWPAALTITTATGRLFVGAVPLTPTSETTFDSNFGAFEFSVDSAGLVKALTVSGGLKYERNH
jgi:hypothetical protein